MENKWYKGRIGSHILATSLFNHSVSAALVLLRSWPEICQRDGMMSPAIDQNSKKRVMTSGSSTHWNGRLVEMVVQRNCSRMASACSCVNGMLIPWKTLSWDCLSDTLTLLSNFFLIGCSTLFWSLSLSDSSCVLFPFPLHATFAVVHASKDAFGHGLLPPRIWATKESLTPRTPPTSALQAVSQS